MQSYIYKSLKYKSSLLELFEIFKNEKFPFLLYSGINLDGLGRYSFMGSSPFLVFKSKANLIQIQKDTYVENQKGHPLTVLKKLLNQYRLKIDATPLPFLGGAAGYFAYDLGFLLEDIYSPSALATGETGKITTSPPAGPHLKSKDDLYLPDCYLGFYDTILVYDHKNSQLYIFSSGLPEKNSYLSNKLARIRLDEVLKKLNKLESINSKHRLLPWKDTLINPSEFSSNFSKDSYISAIFKTKDYISRGDIYQLNLSQRFSIDNIQESFYLYKRLCSINPAPFSAYLNFGDFQIISSSPERFLNLNSGFVHTRPMKGTRPRGKSPREDLALKRELLASVKDKAELIMIVDLERNDLGKVCSYGTVKVNQLRNLEAYSTVFQTTSTVTGFLHPDKDCIDLLKACFPGGSITGCPKIRAMQIIEELEPTRRGIYTGSIGYLSFNGNMDLNIAIRTLIKKRNKVYFQVGGGIVADSIPELEYEETLVKANALFRALSLEDEPACIS